MAASNSHNSNDTVVSLAELRQQDGVDGRPLWVCISGVAYDVSQWQHCHPGGSLILRNHAAADATDEFYAFHDMQSPALQAALQKHRIGRLDKTIPIPNATADYRALRRQLHGLGFFRLSLPYSCTKFLFCYVCLAVAVVFALSPTSCTWLPGSSYLPTSIVVRVMLSAFFTAEYWKQCAGLAHDLLHNSVLPIQYQGDFNWLGWLTMSVGFGMSSRVWQKEHNIHHSLCLRLSGEDLQFRIPWFLHELQIPFAKQLGVNVAVAKFAHVLVVPFALVVSRWSMYGFSWYGCFKSKYPVLDAIGLLIHHCTYFCMLFLIPSGYRFLFVVVTGFMFGIILFQIALSHWEPDRPMTKQQQEANFFAMTMLSTRDYASSWYSAWWHVGLDYQIEHHLFPRMPRHKLKAASVFVRELCQKHNLPYHTVSWYWALVTTLQRLRSISIILSSSPAS